MGDWLRRELLAMAGLTGAALTVLAQLMRLLPAAPWLDRLLAYWREFLAAFWQLLLAPLDIHLHPDITTSLNIAVFLVVLGAGVRLSAHLREMPLPRISIWEMNEHMTGWSLASFAAISLVFLLGQGAGLGFLKSPPIVLDSVTLGKWLVILTFSAGFFAGDLLGGAGFHQRLPRLVVFVALAVLVNFAWIYVTPPP